MPDCVGHLIIIPSILVIIIIIVIVIINIIYLTSHPGHVIRLTAEVTLTKKTDQLLFIASV